MDIILVLTQELNVEKWQVEAAVKLIDEGNTIPFISRYRKEVTGALNDEVLRNLNERLTYLRNIEKRKEEVKNLITDMGKMNDGVLRDLVGGLDDESEKVLDTVLDKVLSGVNQNGLLDVKKNFVPALKGGVEAWRSLDRDTQKKFLKIFSDTPEIVFRNSNRIRKERTEKTYEKVVSAFKYLNVLF